MALVQVMPIFCGQHGELVRSLRPRLEHALRADVEFGGAAFDPEFALDRARGQYNSRLLLARLLREGRPDADRVIGVTGLDLFIPVLTYVFGEAQLAGRGAIVSAYRLDNQLYGLPADESLLRERLEKEMLHELGHTFGLGHCGDALCVMASSTTVDGIDVKSEQFCERCARALPLAHSR